MRTTINQEVDRRGCVRGDESYDELFDKMRAILAGQEAIIDLQLEKLRAMEFDPLDKAIQKELRDSVAASQKLLVQVLDQQIKAAERAEVLAGALDLEAARAEILGRLAQLAA